MLSRGEFVSKLSALLARGDSCAIQGTESELHELYDILDPNAEGRISIQDVDRLVRSNQKIWPEQKPSIPSNGPIPRLRQWMLKKELLFIDLLTRLGDKPLTRAEFTKALDIPATMLPNEMISELFVLCGFGEGTPRLCPKELCERIVDAASFKSAMRKRIMRHIVRKVWADQQKNVLAELKKKDTEDTGYLSVDEQYAGYLALGCPPLSVIDKRLAIDSESYESVCTNLCNEAKSMVLVHLQRGSERLAAECEKFESELLKVGPVVTLEQARMCLPKDLRANDFFDLLVKATVGINTAPFKPSVWVEGGIPKWPSPEVMCKNIFGGVAVQAPRKVAPLEHQLTLLFYKIHQTQRKNGLTNRQAFECLAPSGTAIDVEDIQRAVVDLLGPIASAPTCEELGLPKKGAWLNFDQFCDKIAFELGPFQKSLDAAFTSFPSAMPMKDFMTFFVPSLVTKIQCENLLKLLFGPTALTLKEIPRQPLELFLGTVQAPPSCPKIDDPFASVRSKILAAEIAFSSSVPMIPLTEARRLLTEAQLDEAEQALVLSVAVEKEGSGSIGENAGMVRGHFLRSVCLPAPVEHILSVNVGPLASLKAAETSTIQIRYHAAGTHHFADCKVGGFGATCLQSLDLRAEHAFVLADGDSLISLLHTYDGPHAITLTAVAPSSLNAQAVITKTELQAFLATARAPFGGSKTYTLAFGAGSVKLTLVYQRKVGELNCRRLTSSTFKNASVVSEIGTGTVGSNSGTSGVIVVPAVPAAPLTAAAPASVTTTSGSTTTSGISPMNSIQCVFKKLVLSADESLAELRKKCPQGFLRWCLFTTPRWQQLSGWNVSPGGSFDMSSRENTCSSKPYTWQAPILPPEAMEAVLNETLTVELWLGTKAPEVKLGATTLPLVGLTDQQPLLDRCLTFGTDRGSTLHMDLCLSKIEKKFPLELALRTCTLRSIVVCGAALLSSLAPPSTATTGCNNIPTSGIQQQDEHEHVYVEVRSTKGSTVRSAPAWLPRTNEIVEVALDCAPLTEATLEVHVVSVSGCLLAHGEIQLTPGIGNHQPGAPVKDGSYWFPLYQASSMSPFTKGRLIGRLLGQASFLPPGDQKMLANVSVCGILPSGVHLTPFTSTPPPQVLRDLLGGNVDEVKKAKTWSEVPNTLPPALRSALESSSMMSTILKNPWTKEPLDPWALVHWIAIRLVAHAARVFEEALEEAQQEQEQQQQQQIFSEAYQYGVGYPYQGGGLNMNVNTHCNRNSSYSDIHVSGCIPWALAQRIFEQRVPLSPALMAFILWKQEWTFKNPEALSWGAGSAVYYDGTINVAKNRDFFDYHVFLADVGRGGTASDDGAMHVGIGQHHHHQIQFPGPWGAAATLPPTPKHLTLGFSSRDALKTGSQWSRDQQHTDVPRSISPGLLPPHAPHFSHNQDQQQRQRGLTPAPAPKCSIHIAQAVHLRKLSNQDGVSPNAFVVLKWSTSPAEIGRTPIIYKSTCPAWLHDFEVALPRDSGENRWRSNASLGPRGSSSIVTEGMTSGGGGGISGISGMTISGGVTSGGGDMFGGGDGGIEYPEGYKNLSLELYVYHNTTKRNEPFILMGSSTVGMAPLCYLREIDGYYTILSPNEGGNEDINEGEGELEECGQIRLTIRPAEAAVRSPAVSPTEAQSSASLKRKGQEFIQDMRQSFELRSSMERKKTSDGLLGGLEGGLSLSSSFISHALPLNRSMELQYPSATSNSNYAFSLKDLAGGGVGGGTPIDVPSETALRFAAQLREHESSLRQLTKPEDLKQVHLDNMRDLENCVSSMLRRDSSPQPPDHAGCSGRLGAARGVPTRIVHHSSQDTGNTFTNAWPITSDVRDQDVLVGGASSSRDASFFRSSSPTPVPVQRRSVENARALLFHPTAHTHMHRMEVVDDLVADLAPTTTTTTTNRSEGHEIEESGSRRPSPLVRRGGAGITTEEDRMGGDHHYTHANSAARVGDKEPPQRRRRSSSLEDAGETICERLSIEERGGGGPGEVGDRPIDHDYTEGTEDDFVSLNRPLHDDINAALRDGTTNIRNRTAVASASTSAPGVAHVDIDALLTMPTPLHTPSGEVHNAGEKCNLAHPRSVRVEDRTIIVPGKKTESGDHDNRARGNEKDKNLHDKRRKKEENENHSPRVVYRELEEETHARENEVPPSYCRELWSSPMRNSMRIGSPRRPEEKEEEGGRKKDEKNGDKDKQPQLPAWMETWEVETSRIYSILKG